MNILFDLQLFAFTPGTSAGTTEINPVNITTQSNMAPTMKVFYDTTLLENSRESEIYAQFGKKQPVHGNKVEWRKFNTFAKATSPLSEGVIPEGKTFGMTKIEATTSQYGDYTVVSDRLELESYDDVIYGATEEMGATAGATKDTLTRNVLVAGNSVMYCPNGTTAISSRATLTNACILTPNMVKKAATWLKKHKAPTIDGSYVAIIHPSVAYDLTSTQEWMDVHKYADVKPIFKGEIGELYGVRFIESNEAKVFASAGASSVAVYATLFLGKDAFGIVEPSGETMEMIIKNRGEIGGPLEQFSTIGYKFCHATKILYEDRVLRVESGSSYGSEDAGN